MREMGCTKKVIVGAWYTAPYGIRVVRRGGVVTNECKVEDRIHHHPRLRSARYRHR